MRTIKKILRAVINELANWFPAEIVIGVLAQFIVIPIGLISIAAYHHYAAGLGPKTDALLSLISVYGVIAVGIAICIAIEWFAKSVGLHAFNPDWPITHYNDGSDNPHCRVGYSARQLFCRKAIRWGYCIIASVIFGFWLESLLPNWLRTFQSTDVAACSMFGLLPASMLLALAAAVFPRWALWLRVRTVPITAPRES